MLNIIESVFTRPRQTSWIALLLLCAGLAATNAQAQASTQRRTTTNRPTIKLVIPSVQMVQPDAEVSVTIGQASVKAEQDQAQARGTIAGDLAGVALTALRSRLYIRAPQATVYTRDLSRSPAQTGTPTWLYDLRIESFQEYRDAQGNRGTAVDAALYISDENGRPVASIAHHDPPLAQRKTDEDIAREIRRMEEGQAIMGAFRGTILDPVLDLAQRDVELKKQQILSNYQFSENPTLNDYQFQEQAVRRAVETVLDQAPMPGESPAYEVSIQLEQPRLRRSDQAKYAQGVSLLQQTMYDEAIAVWEDLGDDNVALQFNLGVANLGNATRYMSTQPHIAYEKARAAGMYFAKASGRHGNTAAMNATRQLLQNIESHYGGPPPEGQAVVRESEPSRAVEVPPITAIGKKYALLIGVGKFINSSIPPLSAPARDVGLLQETLLAIGFRAENIITLIDEQATRQGILRALDQLAHKVSPDSLALISISTHGSNPLLGDIGNEGYILCYDSAPDALFETAYPVLDFREHVDRRLRCKAKVVFQDTCHSAAGSTRFAGTQIKFTEWPAYMAVFAASGIDQPAIEPRDGHGVFTQSVSTFLKNNSGAVNVAMLRDHVLTEVPRVAQGYGYAQTPQVFLGPGAESIVIK